MSDFLILLGGVALMVAVLMGGLYALAVLLGLIRNDRK